MVLKEHAKALSASLAEAKLVPGVAASLIPEDFKPTTKLDVAPSDATYMLLFVDPDAPTPDDPKFAFWRHWVLPGLRPLSGDEGMVAQVQPALTEYLGPGPKDE
ncbi:hypothetical protein NW757_011083 [Fusarium falciforme]|nr:hypothetical protein NW757_011083 [Fusarium falciforme]